MPITYIEAKKLKTLKRITVDNRGMLWNTMNTKC